MRRKISVICLLVAWLFANGVTWNVVQVVAWARMYRDNARIMPATQALQLTFSGEAPCDLCRLADSAKKTADQQLPHDAIGSGSEKFLLACTVPAPVILLSPDSAWPGVADDTGLTRTDAVPLLPPRV
ncbi:MAG: hypothetical protein ABUL61_05125 [Oleiharenicola lentus]